MLSKDTELRIDHALTDEKLGEELAARLEVSSTPADDVQAQAILDLLDLDADRSLAERLFVGLAGDGSQGKEMARKVNGMIKVLKAKADGTEIAAVAAQAVLNLTTDITLVSSTAGSARNDDTFTLQIAAAAANPTDTVLADFTGTADAITLTITPNDGTNNGAVPVSLTTAEVAELIDTGAVVGKNVTVTDASSLRTLQSASGGGATEVADAGEGDGVVATFSGGSDAADNDVAPAKEEMGAELMSEDVRFHLEHALASKKAADEVKASYDAMVQAIQAIS